MGFIILFDTAYDYAVHFTVTHTPLSTVTSSVPLLGSGLQRRMFPFLCVPELSAASATSSSQQQLATTKPPAVL
jgi:hypothetical protein